MKACVSCGSTHMAPVPCGMTWGERMRSVRLDEVALETRDVKNYYDRSAVEAVVGHDSVDRLYDETDGIGYTRQDKKGDWYYRNRKTREIEKLSERQMDVMTGANDEVSV